MSLGATIAGRAAGSDRLTGCWSYPFKTWAPMAMRGAITTNDPDVK